MKCKNWKIQISAYLDGALDKADRQAVIQHIESCRECRIFHEKHLALSSLFSVRAEGKSPSPFIWNKIERRITSANRETSRPSLLDHFRLPRLAYGMASAMLLISLAALVQLRKPSVEDRQLLAEMDTYTMDVQGNPFLKKASIEIDNPFFRYETGSANPFNSNLEADK